MKNTKNAKDEGIMEKFLIAFMNDEHGSAEEKADKALADIKKCGGSDIAPVNFGGYVQVFFLATEKCAKRLGNKTHGYTVNPMLGW